MIIPLARLGAAAFALLSPYMLGQGAAASDRTQTRASVTIVQSAAVTVVNNASLQTLLLTVALAPVGVVFATPGSAPAGIGPAGPPPAGGGAAGATPPGGAAGGLERAGGPGAGSAPAGLVIFAGSLGGTTISGDAVSVSVGNVSGGTAPGSARVSVVIAQFN